jgi:hypothetical protein
MTELPAISAAERNIFDSSLDTEIRAVPANEPPVRAAQPTPSGEHSPTVGIAPDPGAGHRATPRPVPAEPLAAGEEPSLGGWESEDDDTFADWSPGLIGPRQMLQRVGRPLAWALAAFLVFSALVALLSGSHHPRPAAPPPARPAPAAAVAPLPIRSAPGTEVGARARARRTRRHVRARHATRRRRPPARRAARRPSPHARASDLQPPIPPAPIASVPIAPSPPTPPTAAPVYAPPPAPASPSGRGGEFGFEQ